MPHTPSLPTPSNPSASGTTFYGRSTITAPASLIWSTLLDFHSYTWNTFTPTADFSSGSASRPIQVGDTGTLSVCMDRGNPRSRPTHVQVTLVDSAARRLSWKGVDYPPWALRPERMMEVVELEGGRCEFRSYETMAGPGAWVVAWMMGGQLDEANRRCADDLKRVVESKVEGE